MNDVEIKCPHCDKKIIIPESLLVKIIDKYQQNKIEENPTSIEGPKVNTAIQELDAELVVKKEQLSEVMSKLERNQADLTRVVKRSSVKTEDMYRIQKERTILIQKAKNFQDEIAAIKNQIGKLIKNQM